MVPYDMKKSTIAFWSITVGLALGGCGQSGSSSGSSTGASNGPLEVDLTANDLMRYNQTSIEAAPGQELKVVFTNIGSTPKEAMAHNWVLLKKGSDPLAFSQAAISAKDTDYIPPSLKDEIIALIPLQGPHQSGEVDFKAPTEPGDYPFLCSFPAHYQVGMHGVLTVK
jgi:azurin